MDVDSIENSKLEELGIEDFEHRWKLLFGFEALRAVSKMDLGESAPFGRLGAWISLEAMGALPASQIKRENEDATLFFQEGSRIGSVGMWNHL